MGNVGCHLAVNRPIIAAMPFTELPRQVASFKQSKLTQLVAVLGKYARDVSMEVGVSRDDVYFAKRCEPDVPRWTLGQTKPISATEKRVGSFFAVRSDGLVVTEE